MNVESAKYLWAVFVLVMLMVANAAIAYGQCAQGARTTSDTPVYDQPPSFYTGRGWQLGHVVETLTRGHEVRVCEERMVGLFLDKKKWFRIEFGNGRMGWVFAGNLNISATETSRGTFAWMGVADAMAQDSGVPSSGLPGFGVWLVIGGALVFVLLGMVGKVAYDELDKGPKSSLRNCIRPIKYVKTLIAAPLAFGAFLKVGDFSFSNEIAVVVFFCMAFQNGFFWQTLLRSDKPATGAG